VAPQPVDASERRLWLALVDPLPNRVFFDCGIVAGLRREYGDRITGLFPLHPKHITPWLPQLDGVPVLRTEEMFHERVPAAERVARRADIFLDEHAGFHTLAVRHSLRHGFNRERWAHGHPIAFLDIDRAGRLPRWKSIDRLMSRWLFSGHRYVPARLASSMKRHCGGLVVTNLQAHVSMPYLVAARKLRVPVVGYVASWDHTVGKGVVSPHLDRYVVQNETMCKELERYHGIDPARVVVTGWPQTDVYHRRRPREAFDEILDRYGLDTGMPLVLFAGNTPDNAPYEGRLVERLVTWWRETGADRRFSLLFRPHPRDGKVAKRFAAATGLDGVAVQAPSYTDLEDLATLLQHADVVVANAGTILLDSLVNDRPAVCVLFDEGAPPGERWADRNLAGDHYRRLAESDAFLRAHDFGELVTGVERALVQPGELADKRRRIARELVGDVDGKAAERVVEAIATEIRL
jgi:hypothetical protein